MLCAICLDNFNRRYFNLCNRCNNFYVCHDCYKEPQTQELRNCSICRSTLHKRISYSFNNFLNFLIFYRHLILHSIFNILLPNIAFSQNFPIHNNHYFIQNKIAFLLFFNICQFIITPLVYTSFKYQFLFINYPSCVFNFSFYILLFYTNDNAILYFIYNIIYMYTLLLGIFCCITMFHLIKLLYLSKKQFIRNYNIFTITIYSTHFRTS